MDTNQSILLDGKYEVLQKLSEGGMGTIYKVRHLLLDEIRVAKVMRPHAAADPEMERRFLREAKLAIRVRHANIAQLYDYSVDGSGTAVMVLEFIDGVTLRDVIRSGPPPSVPLATELAVQALQALACLHTHGIVHRDVASDNIMLTLDSERRPLVKLIDLGIAKAPLGEATATEAGGFLGKARYSAPEQFSSGALGPSADIYSFGVVLYELLTRRFPIEGVAFADLAAGHLFRAPVPFVESDPKGRVPDGLRDAVLQALDKDPERRIASAEAFAERLRPYTSARDADPVEVEQLIARARGTAPPTSSSSSISRPSGSKAQLRSRTERRVETLALSASARLSAIGLEILEALDDHQSAPVRPPETDWNDEPDDAGTRAPSVRARRHDLLEAPARGPRLTTLVVGGILGIVVVAMVLFITFSRRDLYGERIAAVLDLPEGRTEEVDAKLQEVAALIVLLPKDDERGKELVELKEQLTNVQSLLRFVGRLEALLDDARSGRIGRERVEQDAPKIWEFMKRYRAKFAATDATAVGVERRARATLRQIADEVGSTTLREVADAP